jgi:hypothetical protein
MSDNDYKSSSPEAQLGGARRKNGHKSNCACHICENMKNKAKRGGYEEDMEKEQLKKMGGSKKKNGHKPDCGCPICKNMKHAKKRGGDNNEVEEIDIEESENEPLEGGRKKKGNGHKANCKCPICKNMKKSKRGGYEPDIENQLGDIEEGGIPARKNMTNQDDVSQPKGKEISASDDEYDILVAAEKGEAGPNIVGGTRKRKGSMKRHRRSMKKGRKTMRRHRKRSHRRR